MSPEFLLTSLIVVATPGTGAIYSLSVGLSQGRRASVMSAIGNTIGIVPHLLASLTGLAALMNASTLAFQTVKYAGVMYLMYMAWKIFTDHDAITVTESSTEHSDTEIITRAVLINLLNPKLTMFFFAFLPQFVPASTPHAMAQMLLLSGVFMAMTCVIFVAYGLFAAVLRDHVVRRPSIVRWMRRSFAIMFVGLAGKLAVADR